MALGFRRVCAQLHRSHQRLSTVTKSTTAASLGQAVREADTVNVLNLQESPDLLCVNLMCEKVGDPCICRLSRVLEKLHHLEGLNLAGNSLVSLPESIGQLEQLQHLDLSNNNLQSLPKSMQQLRRLKVICICKMLVVYLFVILQEALGCGQVINLKGNRKLASIGELQQLSDLKEIYLDHELVNALPADLRQLAKQ